MTPPAPEHAPVRRRVVVHGVVQGVGFRPFVYRLAVRHGLAGWVRNDGAGVQAEVEGPAAAVAAFRAALRREAPARSTIRSLRTRRRRATGERDFRILPSDAGSQVEAAPIPPDIATCDACLAELRDPGDRRHRYPFLNCTDCGPRYTIVRGLPYDRPRTTMAPFPLCEACAAEYGDPADRRFHAQPTACAACGPRLTLWAGDRAVPGDPLSGTIRRLEAGAIAAVKGLGGYHLACDATAAAPVAALRARKQRPDKPFAVMARDLPALHRLARVTRTEAALLQGWRRPIVLLEARPDGPLDPGVGGSSRWIGAMLPYTPLHHLLLEGRYPALVMTSGNRRDEPIVIDDGRARRELGGVADVILIHDRAIEARADDSVARVVAGRTLPVRRSRGWVPAPIALPRGGPPVLAVGGDLKNTCAITRGDAAFLGAHVGDLEHPAAMDAHGEAVDHLRRLLGVELALVVHDLHPDYHGTRWARQQGLPTLAVQHHHAHGLACLAEHGHDGPALALALDGTGYGTDGHVWGGELLAVDVLRFERLAHLRERSMPGADRAAREPWRMALSVLHDACGELDGLDDLPPLRGAPPAVSEGVRRLLARGDAGPRTSSAGRLFDAAAALLGLCQVTSFEGQAGMALEQAAARARGTRPLPYHVGDPGRGAPRIVDLDPAFRALVDGVRAGTPRRRLARAFHQTLAAALVEVAADAAERTALHTVALTGGVLLNGVLARMLRKGLRKRGLRVLMHHRVPPSDGGLALGQAWAGVLAGETPEPG